MAYRCESTSIASSRSGRRSHHLSHMTRALHTLCFRQVTSVHWSHHITRFKWGGVGYLGGGGGSGRILKGLFSVVRYIFLFSLLFFDVSYSSTFFAEVSMGGHGECSSARHRRKACKAKLPKFEVSFAREEYHVPQATLPTSLHRLKTAIYEGGPDVQQSIQFMKEVI